MKMHLTSVLAAFSMFVIVTTAATSGAQTLVLETADGSANVVGFHTSLGLDASGNPHVSYFDQTTADLKYARKSGGVWTIATVDAANSVGEFTSLALDASGNPHVSYYTSSFGDLKYARKSGGAWTIETVDGLASTAGFYTSLALDASGNPHVSYYDATIADLKYARKSGGVWTIEIADGSANNAGAHSSLALDASGNPQVSYQDFATGDLKYARKSGGVWTIETVDGSANSLGTFTSLELDASGNPHVSYLDETIGDLKYARKSGGVWTIETVDGSELGQYTSLELDASGNPHVSYRDVTPPALKYARKSGGVWTRETADGSANNAGHYPSLALDASGNPHVSYQDQTTGDLRYAFIPSLLISSPQPGVTWPVGSEQALRWSYTGGLATDNTDVFLSLDGGNNYTLISDDARDFELAVRVPHTPTRFARIKLVQPSPFTVGQMDSFFTIDATIALSKFDAVAIDGTRNVSLSWKTTPGPEASVRYRVERAVGASGDAGAFTSIHAGALDRSDFLDEGAGALAPAAAPRYRLIAINGLGEEYALGETRVAPRLADDRLLTAAPSVARDGVVALAFRSETERAPVDLAFYDVSGRRVRTIVSRSMARGVHEAAWDGRDDSGRDVAAGAYWARLETAGLVASERVIVIR